MKTQLLALAMLTIISSRAFCETDVEAMEKLSKAFSEHKRDLVKCVEGNRDDVPAFAIANSLQEIASHYAKECLFLTDELTLFVLVKGERDNLVVQNTVLSRFRYLIEDVDTGLTSIDRLVGAVKRPVLLAEADKLKTDLKALKQRLQKIREDASCGCADR